MKKIGYSVKSSWIKFAKAKNIISFIFVFVAFLNVIYSQTAEDYRKYADEALSKGDYYTASVLYKNLLDKDKKNIELAYLYANSNRLYNNYVEAAEWYLFVMKNDKSNKNPLSEFYYAEMNKYMGNYSLALQNFKNFHDNYKEKNDFYSRKALQEILSCKWAIERTNDSATALITHLGKNVNTPFSEFGAVQMGDSVLIYSSLRRLTENDFETYLPDVYLSKVYYSWISIAGYSSARDLKGKVNADEEHTANITFDFATNIAYFTRCASNENGEMICRIFESSIVNGKWGKAKPLNNLINSEGSTNTQPAFAKIADKEILYFSSNRQGGFGQMDIWYSIKYNNDFSKPVNLGSRINTSGNEISPFYNNYTGNLYFASDWHKGFGGFDIFKSGGEQNQWTEPENMGKQINTSYNDMYFTVNAVDSTEGYFTSNRKGSYYIKGETCCNDIYSYELITRQKPEPPKKDTVTIEESIRKLLPLTLYFHNDEPDPSTLQTTTDKNYTQTLADYYAMMDKYKLEYSKGLKGEEKQKAILDIESFFKDNAVKGFNQLETFAALLLRDLQKGNEIRITVKGYASPLNTEEYNVNLTKRRISSLVNYLKEYKDGIFVPYMNNNDSSKVKLYVYEEPLGKSMAAKTVSDNPNDLRNSVYSKAAALERKIQILYYDYTKQQALEAEADSTPIVKFVSDSVNYGKLSKQTTNAFTINFTNAGNYPLRISDITSDCNCIRFYWDEKLIVPGENSKINLLIITDEKQGKQKATLKIDLLPKKSISFPLYFEGVK